MKTCIRWKYSTVTSKRESVNEVYCSKQWDRCSNYLLYHSQMLICVLAVSCMRIWSSLLELCNACILIRYWRKITATTSISFIKFSCNERHIAVDLNKNAYSWSVLSIICDNLLKHSIYSIICNMMDIHKVVSSQKCRMIKAVHMHTSEAYVCSVIIIKQHCILAKEKKKD